MTVTYYVGGSALPVPDPGAQTPCDRHLGGDAEKCPGMATYSALALNANLSVSDRPLPYVPAFGPSMDFTFTYLQSDTRASSGWTSSHIGPNWNFNWFSWVEDNPNPMFRSGAAGVYARGGGYETYEWSHSGYSDDLSTEIDVFPANRWNNSKVYRKFPVGSPNLSWFERHFRDGTIETYAASNGATVSPRRFYLTEVRDAWGNKVTLSYSGAGTGAIKLLSITDAPAQAMTPPKTTVLHYTSGDPLRLTKITDPLGRSATLAYHTSGELESITDPVGVVSHFEYGPGHFLRELTTPYGTSEFILNETPTKRTLTMKDARNATEIVEYRHPPQPPPQFPPASWQAREDERINAIIEYNNNRPFGIPALDDSGVDWWKFSYGYTVLDSRNPLVEEGLIVHSTPPPSHDTYFWSKKATGGNHGDDADALRIHWKLGRNPSLVSGTPAWEKAPLEAEVTYTYPNQSDAEHEGTQNSPISLSRVLDNGNTQKRSSDYNAAGSVTKMVDPLGRVTLFAYPTADSNDLATVRQQTSNLALPATTTDLLAKFENYVNHQPQIITDAAGKTTNIGYNARGQVDSISNPRNEVTKFTYEENAAAHGYGRIKTVVRAFGTVHPASTDYGYDSADRLEAVTGSDGFVVTLEYDKIGGDASKTLDRVTKVKYPDLTCEEMRYDDSRWPLDIAHLRDRLGHETAREFDALRNLSKVTDAEGRITQFVNCPCGAMDKIINGRGKVTEWHRDLQKRITSKTIDGGLVATYGYENKTSRVKTVTDALNQVTTYTYFDDDSTANVTYSGSVHTTPDVGFTYETYYPRISTMTDGTGLTSYGYIPVDGTNSLLGDGQLQTIDGPLANDTITYAYDEVGRSSGRKIDGTANATSWDFDALGRRTAWTNPLGTFTPQYVAQTNRPDTVTRTGGMQVDYNYHPNTAPAGTGNGDRRLAQIVHLGATQNVISQFDYTYDAAGHIQHWSRAWSGTAPTRLELGYDDTGMLTGTTLKDTGTNLPLKSYGYTYDLNGNRQTNTEDGALLTATLNGANQVTAEAATNGVMKFKGTVNEPATVTLAGQTATLWGLTWDANAAVTPGLNHLELRATETTVLPGLSAQTTTRHLDFTLNANRERTFGYDANGSLTDANGTTTYEWDGANRLVGINYAGTNRRTEFSYDGLSRWTRIVEKNGATTVSDKRFVWDGMEIAEERDAGNTVTKRFYDQGVRTGTANYFYTRDHLGSIREVTDGTGAVVARYDYSPWGERLKQTGTFESDFGFTGHYYHLPSRLHLAPFRAYDATSGRWLSRDPIGEGGGLNLYGYVSNHPTNAIDLDGQIEVTVVNANMAHSELHGKRVDGLSQVLISRPDVLVFENPAQLYTELKKCVRESGEQITRLNILAHNSQARITFGPGHQSPESNIYSGGGAPKGIDQGALNRALSKIGSLLAPQANIDLYMCNASKGDTGKANMLYLSQILGGVPVFGSAREVPTTYGLGGRRLPDRVQAP